MALTGLYMFGVESCENMGHPNMQKLLKSDQKFDLLLLEFFNTDCFAALSHYYRIPIIGIFSSTFMPWHNDRFGNPDNPAYIPNHFLQLSSRMSFFERTLNSIMLLGAKLAYRLVYDPSADSAVSRFIGPGIPPVRDIVQNTSLFLINTHFSLFQPRPLVPAIVEIGGFHVGPSMGKIPEDILWFIEDSPHGVIFFSLGSVVKASTMQEEKLKIFQEVFEKLPQKVLWKWEGEEMPGKPKNVRINKWLPQNDILAHPNVKLFITHSGLMGTEEAVYHGVPLLMMPLFGDQPNNAAMTAEKGVGVIVDYYTLTNESLSNGIKTVLHDKSYADNAKRLSKIFRDRPLSTMDTAVYWTEYVIRHQGASHLRSSVIDLSWYEKYLLDVIAFLLSCLIISYYVMKRVFMTICCRRKSPPEQKKIKKK